MRIHNISAPSRGGLWRRALVVSTLVGALGALVGCSSLNTPGTDPGPGPAPVGGLIAADIAIVEDPTGGEGVTDLACTFEATQLEADGTDPIEIRVDWSASCGTHKSEIFTFRGDYQVFTSTYEDPTGMPIGMTFWATISWTDSRGGHILRSARAVCTY